MFPQEKAIVIRMTRDSVCPSGHRGVAPSPWEGLDLFTPVVSQAQGSSSDSSESEEENDNWSDSENETPESKTRSARKGKGLKIHISTKLSDDSFIDVEGDTSEKDFEIEKVHILYIHLVCQIA